VVFVLTFEVDIEIRNMSYWGVIKVIHKLNNN
jgi:hypothetical protein